MNPMASFHQVMDSCPIHPRSINSKRQARRRILFFCDLTSLRTLRLVSRGIGELAAYEEDRYFHDLRITLNLNEASWITQGHWIALERIGKLARRVVIVLTVPDGRKKIKFEPRKPRPGSDRIPTMNPLAADPGYGDQGKPVAILGEVFKQFGANDEEQGLFKRVFILTPNMRTLCLRDQVIWHNARSAEVEASWGRNFIDEALIYIRCQLEETHSDRRERLCLVEELIRIDELARSSELEFLKRLIVLKKLSIVEKELLDQLGTLGRLNPVAKSEAIYRVNTVVKQGRYVRLYLIVQLEQSLFIKREEVAKLREQVKFPHTLEMQVGSPLALWHLRTFPGYGDGGDPFQGAGAWSTIKTLSLTLPSALPGLTYGRRRTVMKGIHEFLGIFSRNVEDISIIIVDNLSISGASAQSKRGSNPLTYESDSAFGGGAISKTIYPLLKRLSLKGVNLAWEKSLEIFFMERALHCLDLVLINSEFLNVEDCRKFYKTFEIQNPERLRHSNVPVILSRTFTLPGANGFDGRG